jgi:two-component system, sensor histidine kinase and response regulator
VLLVEDHPVNREVALAHLKALGLQVDVAENGIEAVEKVQVGTFDLVLMDCQMPLMDGYEATAHIRRLPDGEGETLPIIALTANAMQDDRNKCLDAGMDDFITKPFTPAQLRQMLARWLPDLGGGDAPAQPAPAGSASGAGPLAPGQVELPAAASAAAINLQVLRTLRSLDTSPGGDLVRKVLQTFLESAPPALAQIESASRSGDAPTMSRLAHALKSSAANAGADGLSALYRRLELLGREARLDEARALLDPIRIEHERAMADLRRLVVEVPQ